MSNVCTTVWFLVLGIYFLPLIFYMARVYVDAFEYEFIIGLYIGFITNPCYFLCVNQSAGRAVFA